MQCRFVINTYELEELVRDYHHSCRHRPNGDTTSSSSRLCAPSSSILKAYWDDVIIPSLLRDDKDTAVGGSGGSAPIVVQHDQHIVDRIARYRRGLSSPFLPWLHYDTRSFAVGSLALRMALKEAHNDLKDIALHNKACEMNAGVEKPRRNVVVRLLRDAFEGRPHFWSVCEDACNEWSGERNEGPSSSLPICSSSPLCQSLAKSPPFPACPLWNASLSHQGPLVAVASHPTRAVGIDIATIETSPPLRLKKEGSACGSDDNTLCYDCSHSSPLASSASSPSSPPSSSLYPTAAHFKATARRHHEASQREIEDFFEDFVSYFTREEWNFIRRKSREEKNKKEGESGHSDPPHDQPYGQLKRFYILWALKEAFIKAIGVGMGMALQSLSFRIAEGGNNTMLEGGAVAFSPSPPCSLLLYSPSQITLLMDGVALQQYSGGGNGEEEGWSFAVYDLCTPTCVGGETTITATAGTTVHESGKGFDYNAVVAIAEGPMEGAALHSHWGREVLEAAKRNSVSGSDFIVSSPPPSLVRLPLKTLMERITM